MNKIVAATASLAALMASPAFAETNFSLGIFSAPPVIAAPVAYAPMMPVAYYPYPVAVAPVYYARTYPRYAYHRPYVVHPHYQVAAWDAHRYHR